MSISKRIRTRVASSLSRFEETETFLWIKLLRPGELDYREIETLSSELSSTDNIPLQIEASDEMQSIKFNFNKPKTLRLSKRKLLLRSKTNPVFFGFGNISVSNIEISFDQHLKQFFAARIIVEGTSVHFNIKEQKKIDTSSELTSKIINLEKYLLNSKNYFNTSKPTGKRINAINYFIKEPEIIDYLSRMQPEIYNIELLTKLEHSESGTPVESKKIDLLDNPVSIKKVDEREFSINKEQLYSPFEFNPQIITSSFTLHGDLFPWSTRQVKIKIPEFNNLVNTEFSIYYETDSTMPVIMGGGIKDVLADGISKIIQPKMDLSPEEEGLLFESLYPFQVQGVKFLASNSEVLFCNEPVTGKTVQAIYAIKYLLKKREIKYCLVITHENLTESDSITSIKRTEFGWPDKLQKFAPEISFNNVDPVTSDFNAALAGNSQIQIITYEVFLKAFTDKTFKKDILKKFDCLILEDAGYINSYQNEIIQMINLIQPKFNWIITNLNKKEYADNVSPGLNHKNILCHKYAEIRPQLPGIIESDFWIDLGKEHRDEFHQVMFHARNSLQDILATGNPFRLQSQIFFYMHQLNQVCNFQGDNIESNKTALLLSHINSIRSFNKQAVIFTQYDKAGIQKLVRLFEREKINYRKYTQGMKTGELTSSISDFEKDASVTVFLADTQIVKAKSNLFYAPYIIHFDQWWTPISRWDLENKIRSSSNRPIIVLNYFTKNTLDEKIQSLLFEKGMLDRKNSAKIGADAFSKILTEEEWTKVFELEKAIKPEPEEQDDEDNSEKT